MRTSCLKLAFAIAVLALAPGRVSGQWSDQTLESIDEFALSTSSLQVDASGRPSLFVGGDRVYRHRFDGSSWRREIVDPVARSGGAIRVATGPDGAFHLVYDRVHISGESEPHYQLFSTTRIYATNRSGEWLFEEVPLPPDTSTGEYSAVTGIAVDSSHAVHLLFEGHIGVFHAVRSAAGWSFERLDVDPVIGQGVSAADRAASSQLALDASGGIHAVWFRAWALDVVYSHRDSGGWHHEVLNPLGGGPLFAKRDPISLLVDAAGRAHVLVNASRVSASAPLRFFELSKESGVWAIDEIGEAPAQHAAALDPDGRPHVVWLKSSGSYAELRVVHTWRDASSWQSEPVYGAGAFSARFSLAVDVSGGVHAAALLRDFGSAAPLLSFSRVASGWIPLEVARSGPVPLLESFDNVPDEASVGADVRIALDGGRRTLVCRTGPPGRGGALRHAEERAGGFEIETVPLAFPDPRTLAFAMESDGTEHAAWVGDQVSHAIHRAGVWTQELATSSTEGGPSRPTRRPGLVVSGGHAHILYTAYDATAGPFGAALRETTDASGTWHSEVVAGVVEVFDYDVLTDLALAAGPLGSLHAAYLDDSGVVAHATNQSGAWRSEIVGPPDFGTGIGSHTLLVERDGTVHIAYERLERGPAGTVASTGLMYATNRCRGGWYRTEVDPLSAPATFRIVGSRNPDLALDASGNPHISYRREADESLGYARRTGNAWRLETVVANTSSGLNSAIAVAPDGVVSIAHHDAWAGDLRLATREAIQIEPRWDGCPPLPDPKQILDGRYVFSTPAGSLALYDPGGEFGEEYGTLRAVVRVRPRGNTKLDLRGDADVDANDQIDSGLSGKGTIAVKRGGLQVKRSIALRDSYKATPPSAGLKLTRLEAIDPYLRRRTVSETVRGKIDGAKFLLERSFEEDLPLDAFGLALALEIHSAPGGLTATGSWTLRGGDMTLLLSGRGQWSPSTSSAELLLEYKPRKVRIRLTGLRVWRSDVEGVRLRADTIEVRALGQELNADLSGSW